MNLSGRGVLAVSAFKLADRNRIVNAFIALLLFGAGGGRVSGERRKAGIGPRHQAPCDGP